MFVDNDLRLSPGGAETVADEIDLRLHDGKIVLRSALQNKARSKRREIRNAGDIEEDVLRQHSSEPGKNLLRPPSLPLEVHNVGLHEHRAAIAENRHSLRRECQVRILRHIKPKALDRRLQEISVACRALRVQLEVLHAALVQDDDLDVLPAHVDDDVRIFVELERRFRVRDRFDQRNICVENVFENVLRITGRRNAQHFKLGVLRFHLAAQVLEHLNRVLNRIAVRELIRLAENIAVLAQQNGFGRSRTAVEADETTNRRALLKHSRSELLAPIRLL